MRFYQGTTGLKTGYTSAAGHCLAASAKRDGIELIAVVLHCASSADRFSSPPDAGTPKEFDLLLLFVQNRNIALFRETIYERVWGTEFTGDSRTVDLHVQRLRRKLGWQGKLLTIYKTGYRLEVTD